MIIIVSMKNLNKPKVAKEASTRRVTDEEKSSFFLTGVEEQERPGSTVSSRQKEGEKSQERQFFSTYHERAASAHKFGYYSLYDACLVHKFKKKKYEQNIQHQFAAAQKRGNFQGMLKNLRCAFEEKSKKEIDLMSRKNSSFKRAVNQIICEK